MCQKIKIYYQYLNSEVHHDFCQLDLGFCLLFILYSIQQPAHSSLQLSLQQQRHDTRKLAWRYKRPKKEMLFGDTKKKILTMEKLRKMDSNKRSSPFSLGFSSSKRLEIETQEKVIN